MWASYTFALLGDTQSLCNLPPVDGRRAQPDHRRCRCRCRCLCFSIPPLAMDPLYDEGAVGAGDFVKIFPEDILDTIFGYLKLKQRLEAAKVCRSWRWFLLHIWRRMWQQLDTEPFGGFTVSSYDLYADYIRYQDVQKLNLAYYRYDNGEISKLLRRFLDNGTRSLRKRTWTANQIYT